MSVSARYIHPNICFFCVTSFVLLLVLPLATAQTVLRPILIPNDYFEGRALLVGDYISVEANNNLATPEPGEPNHAQVSSGHSLWWTWVAPEDGWAHITTTDTTFRPCFAVYTGHSLSNLQRVAYSQQRCYTTYGSPEISTNESFRVTSGRTYQIAFDSPRDNETTPTFGPIKFSLIFSTLEIKSPINGESYSDQSQIPLRVECKDWPGPATTISLRVDDSEIGLSIAGGISFRPAALAALALGKHKLVAELTEPTGRKRRSPEIEIHVRPENDNFDSALALTGTNIFLMGNDFYATLEPGEPNPNHNDGFTVWYRWTAPRDGIVRLKLGQSINVYRGTALADLSSVANSFVIDSWILPTHLFHLVHFAAENGVEYFFQVSSKFVGIRPLPADSPCGPAWAPQGYPFSLQLTFYNSEVGPIETHSEFRSFPWDRQLFFVFAAKNGSDYLVENSADLTHWSPYFSGRASGATEIVRAIMDLENPGIFYRVRVISTR